MPGHARKDIVREGEVATYHCWSRVVQKAFLCGYDPESDRDFEYRRDWIENLLAYQASVFALDVGNFNVLSNHAHTILRTRPDIAATWSDEEIDSLLGMPEKLQKIRRDLSSLSWFMARWKEPIARICNAEMDRAGHFWEARFGSRELLDDAAVLACSIYVDLNQIQAGMANSLEDSRHSSIRNRILAAKRREAQTSREEFERQNPTGLYLFPENEAETLFEDCWLAPICSDGPLLTTASLEGSSPVSGTTDTDSQASVDPTPTPNSPVGVPTADHSASQEPDTEEASQPSPSPARRLTRRRASDSPIIDVPWPEYLRVLESVAAFTSSGEPGSMTAAGRAGPDGPLEEVLTRWGINAQAWLTEFQHLDHRCWRALGAAHQMLRCAGEVAQRWFHGIGWCREVFIGSESSVDTCT